MADGDVANGAVNSKLPQEAPSSVLSGRSSLRDVESSTIFDSTSSKYTSENYRRAVGASYVLTMGVSGVVLVALASSLRDLAIALDKSSVAVSHNPARLRSFVWYVYVCRSPTEVPCYTRRTHFLLLCRTILAPCVCCAWLTIPLSGRSAPTLVG